MVRSSSSSQNVFRKRPPVERFQKAAAVLFTLELEKKASRVNLHTAQHCPDPSPLGRQHRKVDCMCLNERLSFRFHVLHEELFGNVA